MLPNAVILGAQKASTTTVKLALASHPDVDAPRGECAFFEDPYYATGDLAPLERLFEGSTAPIRLIKRPDYLARPECPDRIRAHLPDARLIVILRHPVSRAVSAYLHFVARGQLPLAGLDTGMRRLLDGSYGELPAATAVIEYGHYGAHLDRYTDRFPAEQLLVLLHEEVTATPDGAFDRLRAFLGLGPDGRIPDGAANQSVHSLPRLAVARVRNRMRLDIDRERGHTFPRDPLPTVNRLAATALRGLDSRVLAPLDRRPPALALDLRAELVARYEDDIAAVERYLGLQLPAWRR